LLVSGRKLALLCGSILTLWCSLLGAIAEAGIISTKQEITIGEKLAQQIEVRYNLDEDIELQKRVESIGKRIVSVCDRQELPYSFKVLDVDQVNAMAAPGGFLYVYRGLIDQMPSDDELAGIIGHEVGHVVKRHAMSQLEKTLGMQLLLLGVFGADGLALQMVALDALAAGYSRDDEREADKIGYELALKAGYNPYGMLIGLKKLDRLAVPGEKTDLFSDHPETEERIRRVRKLLTADKVRPQVYVDEETGEAAVVDGAWSLPPYRRSDGMQEAADRAYLTAGRLYPLTKLADYDAGKFILMLHGDNIQILYDDKLITELTPYDAEAASMGIDELVNAYLDALKNWDH